jgi:hypothetical protein
MVVAPVFRGALLIGPALVALPPAKRGDTRSQCRTTVKLVVIMLVSPLSSKTATENAATPPKGCHGPDIISHRWMAVSSHSFPTGIGGELEPVTTSMGSARVTPGDGHTNPNQTATGSSPLLHHKHTTSGKPP